MSAFEEPQLINKKATGLEILNDKVIAVPMYLRTLSNLTRVTIVYLNAEKTEQYPSPNSTFFANIKNVIFKATKDALFSQVNKVYFMVNHLEDTRQYETDYYFRRVLALSKKVRDEYLIYKCVRNK